MQALKILKIKKKLQRWEVWLTLGSESKPGQVGLMGEGEGLAADELPLPLAELQQLDAQSLIAIKTCSWVRNNTHTHINIRQKIQEAAVSDASVEPKASREGTKFLLIFIKFQIKRCFHNIVCL